MIYFVEIIQDH